MWSWCGRRHAHVPRARPDRGRCRRPSPLAVPGPGPSHHVDARRPQPAHRRPGAPAARPPARSSPRSTSRRARAVPARRHGPRQRRQPREALRAAHPLGPGRLRRRGPDVPAHERPDQHPDGHRRLHPPTRRHQLRHRPGAPQAQARGSPLYHHVDAQHIGLAGHSLGGATAYGVGFNSCCRDPRVEAVIAMDAIKLPFGKHRFSFTGKPLLLIHIKGDPVVSYLLLAGHLRRRRAAQVPHDVEPGHPLRALRERAEPPRRRGDGRDDHVLGRVPQGPGRAIGSGSSPPAPRPV